MNMIYGKTAISFHYKMIIIFILIKNWQNKTLWYNYIITNNSQKISLKQTYFIATLAGTAKPTIRKNFYLNS